MCFNRRLSYRLCFVNDYERTETENRVVTSSYLSTMPVTRRVDVISPPPPGLYGTVRVRSHYVTDFETVSRPDASSNKPQRR